jgi:TM2 domain-containing membrane protein YozV
MGNLDAKNNLTQKQLQLLQSEFEVKKKSAAVAYLLLIFLGTLGIHRFYLGRKNSAITQLVLTVVGWITSFFFVGLIFLAAVWIWLVVDLFITAGIVREENERIESEIVARVSTME